MAQGSILPAGGQGKQVDLTRCYMILSSVVQTHAAQESEQLWSLTYRTLRQESMNIPSGKDQRGRT